MNVTSIPSRFTVSRRDMLAGAAGVLAASAVSAPIFVAGSKAGAATHKPTQSTGAKTMSFITAKDGTEIFYKDWGTGQPIVFHHGWPPTADDRDAQGEVVRYVARHGQGRVAKAVLIGAVPPIMVKTAKN